MMLKLNSTLADSQPQNHVLCPVRLDHALTGLSKDGGKSMSTIVIFFSCFAGLLTTCGMADKSAIQTASAAGPTPSRMRKRVNSHLKNVAPLKIILRA